MVNSQANPTKTGGYLPSREGELRGSPVVLAAVVTERELLLETAAFRVVEEEDVVLVVTSEEICVVCASRTVLTADLEAAVGSLEDAREAAEVDRRASATLLRPLDRRVAVASGTIIP